MGTLREEIIRLLAEHREGLTAKEICQLLGIEPEREKEVYSHIEAIARIVRRKGMRLLMLPPRCRQCGFEFEKPKASRCPKCKSERIEPARFKID
ncbi:transcriptional regulator [Archaeoglobus veneficus]|uniref:Transcriptional regulator n=1 Tax=Archaeoglobus veneficus (strain DSM 11195 / SNP6) TaxID=693661 RepID=F2KNR9_ARCVS|nr:transcriptional regulator [Archaeoglobus veneficus]AEA47396.1 transcriptional regulator [Archaeoglobus veneficus SNP6]